MLHVCVVRLVGTVLAYRRAEGAETGKRKRQIFTQRRRLEMKTRKEKTDETKDAILGLLEASGPQAINRISAECSAHAYLGCMAYALAGLQFDGSIHWDEENQVYEVL